MKVSNVSVYEEALEALHASQRLQLRWILPNGDEEFHIQRTDTGTLFCSQYSGERRECTILSGPLRPDPTRVCNDCAENFIEAVARWDAEGKTEPPEEEISEEDGVPIEIEGVRDENS